MINSDKLYQKVIAPLRERYLNGEDVCDDILNELKSITSKKIKIDTRINSIYNVELQLFIDELIALKKEFGCR